MNEQELRLKCIELIIEKEGGYNFPVYQMIEAEMLYKYITEGKLPKSSNNKAPIEIDKLLQKSLDELIKERSNCNQSTGGCNPNSDDLQIPKTFIYRFLSKLRRK